MKVVQRSLAFDILQGNKKGSLCRDCLSSSAPPAGLEPATGRLTRLAISLIEDAIRFSRMKCRNKEKEELRRARSPISNIAFVAFALCGR